jgi:predicted Zn finger-like uncharacterized protein
MIVQCAECKTRYRLDPARVPQQRIRVRCVQCASIFAVDGTQRRDAQPAPGPAEVRPRAAAAETAQVPVRPQASTSAPARPAAASVASAAPPGYGYRDIDLGTRSARPASGSAPAAAPSRGPAAPSASTQTMPDLDLEIERSSGPMIGAARPAAPPASAPGGPARAAEPVAARFVEVDLDRPAPQAQPQEPVDPRVRQEQEKARRLARALVSDILAYNREKRDKALAGGTLVQALGHDIKKSWELYKEKVTPEVANSTNHFREALNEILANGQPIF